MSHRRQQMESTLQKVIGKIFATGLADPRIRGMVSVTSVSVSPDMRNATVGISVIPQEYQKTTWHGIRHAAKHIQSLVLKQMKIRQVPRLDFVLDESLKKGAEVLDAIRKVSEDATNGEIAEPEAVPTDGPDLLEERD